MAVVKLGAPGINIFSTFLLIFSRFMLIYAN